MSRKSLPLLAAAAIGFAAVAMVHAASDEHASGCPRPENPAEQSTASESAGNPGTAQGNPPREEPKPARKQRPWPPPSDLIA